jgi:4-amino-4-deoxy-L-arabinose transferase-like glycosyltransferase
MQKISAFGQISEAGGDTSAKPGPLDPVNVTENSTPDVKPWLGVIVLCVVFCILACVFVPYVGIQHDEGLFAGPIEHEHAREYLLRAFQRDVPLMLLPYLGAAKTWWYALIFKLWEPSIWSVRLPVILLGAATIAVVFLLVRRMAGRCAALVCCAVLATGPSFLLTTTFDWGPAAIQHFCWAAGLYFVLRGADRDSAGSLGAGFAFLGLGMWDKALFVWMLSGAAVATLVLFPRDVRRSWTRRNVAAAVLGFIVGASPLILYNIRQPLSTFRETRRSHSKAAATRPNW